jgi:hypothetical protein
MALRRTGLASRRRSRLGPALSRPLRARPRESCTTSPLEPVSKQRERRLFAYRLLWRAHTINLQPLFIYSALASAANLPDRLIIWCPSGEWCSSTRRGTDGAPG